MRFWAQPFFLICDQSYTRFQIQLVLKKDDIKLFFIFRKYVDNILFFTDNIHAIPYETNIHLWGSIKQ